MPTRGFSVRLYFPDGDPRGLKIAESSKLIRIARESGRSILENANTPSSPPISEADQADAHRFLEDLLTCIEVLGMTALRPVQATSKSDVEQDEMFYLSARGINAQARVDDGEFVLLAGSEAHNTPVSAWLNRPEFRADRARRQALIDDGVLAGDGKVFKVTREIRHTTPSFPTSAGLATSPDPYKQWKTKDGRTLGQVIRGDDE